MAIWGGLFFNMFTTLIQVSLRRYLGRLSNRNQICTDMTIGKDLTLALTPLTPFKVMKVVQTYLCVMLVLGIDSYVNRTVS